MSASISSDSSTHSCNAVPLCATPAWGRPRLMEIPQDIITGYIITALQVRELTQKSMKPITVLRSPVGSLQIQHSLQPYQSSTFLKSGNYILPNLTKWIGRLDQKCNLLERWTKCTLYFWIHLSTLLLPFLNRNHHQKCNGPLESDTLLLSVSVAIAL